MKNSLPLSALCAAVKQAGRPVFNGGLIHQGIIAALVAFGIGGLSRAEEEVWSFVRNEASLSVSLDAPSGTSAVTSGDQRQVNAIVQPKNGNGAKRFAAKPLRLNEIPSLRDEPFG